MRGTDNLVGKGICSVSRLPPAMVPLCKAGLNFKFPAWVLGELNFYHFQEV